MKQSNSSYSSGCPDLLSAGCVTWNGPNIPALGVSNGQVLTETVLNVAKKVCAITGELDLSSLDLNCIIGLCSTCPTNKDLVSVLQLLLDNQCSLKELIDAASGNSTADVTLNLNLKCLKKYDEFENEIPQDLNATLQSIVNQVCSNTTDIALIKNQIIDLQDQISQIDINPTVEEVNIGTCIATARPVSQAVVSVAADLCDYKETVGQVVDIQSAIAKQPAGLNTLLGSVTGWDLSPDKLASSFGNLWLAYTNLLNRVSYMELNCCKISCDSVKVGYIVSIEGTTCTLSFTTGAGTSIPTGFTDCGSVLTISNESNTKSFSVNVIVTQGVTTGSIDLSGFTVGENLSFNLAAKLCSESLNCDKCVTKTVKYTTGGCCVITNEGDDNAVIVYETLLTSN